MFLSIKTKMHITRQHMYDHFESMFKLFEWIYDANSIVQIDFMAVFWRKMLWCCFLDTFWESHRFPYWSLLLRTSLLNDDVIELMKSNAWFTYNDIQLLNLIKFTTKNIKRLIEGTTIRLNFINVDICSYHRTIP